MWDFIDTVAEWLKNPNRRGMPAEDPAADQGDRAANDVAREPATALRELSHRGARGGSAGSGPVL